MYTPTDTTSATVTSTWGPAPPDPTALPIHELHPNWDYSKCIDVAGGIQADGTPVQLYDCNGTPAQKWQLVRGQTQIRLAGTVRAPKLTGDRTLTAEEYTAGLLS